MQARHARGWILIAGIALVAGATLTWAGEGHGHGHGHAEGERHGHGHAGAGHDEMVFRMFGQLDLDDGQKEQVHEILMRSREGAAGTRDRMQAEHDELVARIFADPYDEAAVRDAARRFADSQMEMMLGHARIFQELRGVLDADQMARLEEMVGEHFGGMGGGPGHGKRPGMRRGG